MQKHVIAIISKNKCWRCHCCKELHQFRRRLRAEINHVRCDIVNDGKQSRQDSVDFSFAGCYESIDRL